MYATKATMDISPFILHFTTTVPEAIWNCSCVPSGWMILPRSDRRTIWNTKNAREKERIQRDTIPKGECIYFDEAYERGMKLLNLDLTKIDVNMFTAMSKSLINDGCGLYHGRLILPYEHLSRFQNDLID